MSTRVLVTGASGFVGQHLVPALLGAGYAVRTATRRPVSFQGPVETVIIPDLEAPIDWMPILQDVDIVVHAAGHAHTRAGAKEYSYIMRTNVDATRRLAEDAKSAGVKRFVYVSSVRAQIGAFASHSVREEDGPRPTNLYGRSKLAAEDAIRTAGVPFTIVRPVVMYGSGVKGNIKTLVRIAKLRLPVPIARMTNRRSLLGVDNFISAIIFALNTPATLNDTYLLADPLPLSISEILITLREAMGRSYIVVPIPEFVTRFLLSLSGRNDLWMRFVGDLVVDTRKIESLGWRPPKDTAKGLLEMLHADAGKRLQRY